jgi:ATP-binding cassette subfamily B protein
VLTAGADGLEGIVPVLGAFALGAQRLLPTAQGMFSSWSTIKGATSYLSKVRGFLDETSESAEGVPAKPGPALQFERTIMLEQVRYTYPGAERPALLDLTLSVPAGSRIGVVGPSGSGKSTLIDLLMGLLEPEAGRLVVDDIVIDSSNRAAWQRNIAHVPQHPFLSDASIAENIAFGVPSGQIDIERVMDAASKAHIAEFIESQPDGYGTVVGERGVKLSGGQRQRLAIARALYRQARVLVFDEATSALDHDTEAAVMASIQELSTELTIIMIAHRLSTLRGCDRIIVMTAGRVERVGPYAEVVA